MENLSTISGANRRLGIAFISVGLFFFLPLSVLADELPEVIRLNNLGVHELNNKHWQAAESDLFSALQMNPEYRLARQNLGIAENQWGMSLKAAPLDALVHLHKAYMLNDYMESTRTNIDMMITRAGLHPRLFSDRVTYAEKLERQSDFFGAAAEYHIALTLHEQPDIRQKVDKLKQKLAHYYVVPYRINAPVVEPQRLMPEHDRTVYESYVRKLEGRIAQLWFPAYESTSRRVVVRFDLDRAGNLSNLELLHSSHSLAFDVKVLSLIESVGTFGALPQTIKGLSVTATLDYDASKSTTAVFWVVTEITG